MTKGKYNEWQILNEIKLKTEQKADQKQQKETEYWISTVLSLSTAPKSACACKKAFHSQYAQPMPPTRWSLHEQNQPC